MEQVFNGVFLVLVYVYCSESIASVGEERELFFLLALIRNMWFLLSSVYTITYWLSVRLPYGDILHSLTYTGIRRSSLAHRFGFVFSSSQYVGIRCCSHSTSKIFVRAQNFSTYADE